MAEICSCLCLGKLGMTPNIKNSSAYIESWSKRIKDFSSTDFSDACRSAEQAFNLIFNITSSKDNMANENENSEYAQHSFSIYKPLDKKEKELMLKKINSSLRHLFDIMGMTNGMLSGESEDDRIKRVFIFTSKICGFMTDWLEEQGAAVVLDKDHVQAILTEMVLPMPAMIEGFATDVLKNM